MKITLWGTRGSLASAGPETIRYGGNTACVEVRSDDGSLLILDAGSGIRRLGESLGTPEGPIHILLSHLHLDHIQGLGFFAPLFRGEAEVHLWGPPSTTADLRTRLGRYLSPPLFPVRLRDLGTRLVLHDAPTTPTAIGPFVVRAELVIHPGPTVGYRVAGGSRTLAYLTDHEPALGVSNFPSSARWTSGIGLARDADVLIHDAQYSKAEYPSRTGWGHSSTEHVVAFAELASVGQLITFHHDPSHDDMVLDRLHDAMASTTSLRILPGREGLSVLT
jgi:phosphoribosyl 1,2-cyclic phosphodiesterase